MMKKTKEQAQIIDDYFWLEYELKVIKFDILNNIEIMEEISDYTYFACFVSEKDKKIYYNKIMSKIRKNKRDIERFEELFKKYFLPYDKNKEYYDYLIILGKYLEQFDIDLAIGIMKNKLMKMNLITE